MSTAGSASATSNPGTKLTTEIALLVLLSFLWGGSFTLIKIAVETIPPATMVATRVAVAAILLALFVRWRGLDLPKDAKTWRGFLVQGLLQSALPFTLISWGEEHISSGLAGVLNATPPIFALLITLATRHEQVGWQKIAGVLLGIAGVVTIMGKAALLGIGSAPLAQAAVLGSSLCYALAPMWGRRFAALPAAVTATGAMSCAAILMVPIALAVDRPWTLLPSSVAIAALTVLSVLCTAVAMIIFFRLVQTLGALGTNSGSYLRAGFSVALGVLVLGEAFTWWTLAGMILIVLGTAAVNGQSRWASGRGRPTSPPSSAQRRYWR
ncbi:Permease of the drug/metabolite transporter (DMT) superfamily [Rhizobiales bacterium GAS113]|nr:Permease of the drug/metabolite transporter (DMT) superfamily [Rhizobiales bacterium GAS113]